MRATSLVLFLIANAVNLTAGGFAENNISTKKKNNTIDTAKRNKDEAFHFVSITPAEDKKDEPAFRKDLLKKNLEEKRISSFVLGQSNQMRNIEAWFFPGTSEKKALVIGGVHGTELSSIELAKTLIKQLMNGKKIFYNVIIIPCLFPDNAIMAMNHYCEIGSSTNIGRYSYSTATDPNRQMPSPGEAYDEESGKDHLGREIEKENQLLLQLISFFKPDRVANIHAIRDTKQAGIYADPRTDFKGYALGFETDSSLAVKMASLIYRQGGYIPGNALNKKPIAVYYKDPLPAKKGNFQKRNFWGSQLPDNRGCGVSLGTWASTAISNSKDPALNRDAMRILTIEFPGYKRPPDYTDPKKQNYFRQQVQLYTSAIEKVFLQDYYVEESVLYRF